MKVLITESQFKNIVVSNILLEARSVTDLRGSNPELYDRFKGKSDNFYAVMSKKGDMFILDGAYGVTRGQDSHHYPGGAFRWYKDTLEKLPPDMSVRDGKPLDSLDLEVMLFVDVKNKKIKNVTSESNSLWDRNIDQRYKMTVSEYYNPKMVKNILKELLSKGYITSKFKYISPNQEDITPGSTTDETEDGIFFYHGTTQVNADKIMKVGLRPQDTMIIGRHAAPHLQSFFRENGSTIPGFTDKNIYLSPSLDVAKVYAWRQAAEKVVDPKRPYYKGDKPVVLKVKIPNPSLLMVDDDIAIPQISNEFGKELDKHYIFIRRDDYKENGYPRYNQIYKTDWSGDEEVKDFVTYAHDLIKQNLFNLVQTGEFRKLNKLESHGWGSRFDTKYYMEIKSQLGPAFYEWVRDMAIKIYRNVMNRHYKGTAHNNNASVAYRGVIMPKFITVVPVEYKKTKY